MKRYAAFVWLFARPVWIWNLIFSLSCQAYIVQFREIDPFVFSVVKGLGYLASFFFEYYLARHRLYFFQNAGLSVRKILFSYVVIDFAALLLISLCIWQLTTLFSPPTA